MSNERYEPGSFGDQHRESPFIITRDTSVKSKGRLRRCSPSPAPRRSASPGPRRPQAPTSPRRSRSPSPRPGAPHHRASQHRRSQSPPDIIRLYRQWLEAQGGAYGKGQRKAVREYLGGGHVHANCCLESCTIEENLLRINQNLAGERSGYSISRNLILERPVLMVAIFIHAELPRYVRPERDNVELNLYLEQVKWSRYIRRKSLHRPINFGAPSPERGRVGGCSCSSTEECARVQKCFADIKTKIDESKTSVDDNVAPNVNSAAPASLSTERRYDNASESSAAILAPSNPAITGPTNTSSNTASQTSNPGCIDSGSNNNNGNFNEISERSPGPAN